MSNEDAYKQPKARMKKASLISPAGVLLAFICFFLPWASDGCVGYVWPGASIIVNNASAPPSWNTPALASFYSIFAIELSMLIAFIYFAIKRRVRESRPFLWYGSLIALPTVAFDYLGLIYDRQDMTVIGGFYGTIAGLTISLLAVTHIDNENPAVHVSAQGAILEKETSTERVVTHSLSRFKHISLGTLIVTATGFLIICLSIWLRYREAKSTIAELTAKSEETQAGLEENKKRASVLQADMENTKDELSKTKSAAMAADERCTIALNELKSSIEEKDKELSELKESKESDEPRKEAEAQGSNPPSSNPSDDSSVREAERAEEARREREREEWQRKEAEKKACRAANERCKAACEGLSDKQIFGSDRERCRSKCNQPCGW